MSADDSDERPAAPGVLTRLRDGRGPGCRWVIGLLVFVALFMLAVPFGVTLPRRVQPLPSSLPPAPSTRLGEDYVSVHRRPAGTAPDEAECRAYADRFVDWYRHEDSLGYRLFDYRMMRQRAITGVSVEPSYERELAEQLDGELGKLLGPPESRPEIRLVAVRDVDAEKRLTFRVGTDEFHYLELTVEKQNDGEVWAVDYGYYSWGGQRAARLREELEDYERWAKRPASNGWFGRRPVTGKTSPELEFCERIAVRNWSGALASYERTSNQFRRSPAVQISRFEAVTESLGLEAARGLEPEMRRLIGDSPEFELVSLRGALSAVDYEAADRSAGRLYSTLQDPQLKVVRSDCCRRLKRLDEAARLAREAVDEEPTLPSAHRALFVAESDRGRFDEALAALKEYSTRWPLDRSDVEADPDARAFVGSPVYAEWLKHLNDQPPDRGTPEPPEI